MEALLGELAALDGCRCPDRCQAARWDVQLAMVAGWAAASRGIGRHRRLALPRRRTSAAASHSVRRSNCCAAQPVRRRGSCLPASTGQARRAQQLRRPRAS